MKRYVIGTLLAVFLITACRTDGDKKDVQTYLEETFLMYQERFDDTPAIAGHLSSGLAAHPDSIPLLQSRADLYCGRGLLRECRADTQRLLELKPGSIEGRMMICMLDEFEGADRQIYERCYREVADLYAALPPAASPDMEISNRFNQLFAVMMANSPDVEKEKAAFLAKAASDSRCRLYHEILSSFNRERVLREIFEK